MDSSADICNVFENKVSFTDEFEVNGLRFLFKPLESYEEYLEVRPLVETLSQCPITHCRQYVDVMLRLPSYYPFLVCLVDDSSGRKRNDDTAASSSCDGPAPASGPDSSPATSHIVGYIEVYMMPHLGRLFDSRFERIIVDPKYRNMGVCQKMVATAIHFCRSVLRCNRIDMICNNPVAIHVYEKFGFELVKTNTYRKTLI
ncbi:hypothetical protein, conserved [Babesia bigemina]|uniref:N-acetyltransferase domain-containing protein n=1 Tax=Babesia bigemina TaxID=5866 RepID=A0A061D1G4_BABBI|nr:hypothetical protein, conserved [Babesia bigemina]CDR94641.1 hypothetical protein, conserved [Babesia bigemina]|eukprot:XP_012766827.1 hypothetical protein, conserved [Babesia bigemina]